MGKSKSQRKSSKYFDSDDDTLSTSSTGGFSELSLAQETEEVEGEDSLLEGYVNSMYEKRGSTRDSGLKGLINALTSNVELDFAENRCKSERYEDEKHDGKFKKHGGDWHGKYLWQG